MSNKISQKRESVMSLSGDDYGNRLLDEEDDGDKMKLKNEFAVTTRATQTKNFSPLLPNATGLPVSLMFSLEVKADFEI